MTADSASSAALATLLVTTLALASGCASLPRGAADGADEDVDVDVDVDVVDDFPRSRLVALDFVDAMVRLPELDPARTTLYTARPPSRFGEILVVSLQDAGYDLRLGPDGAPATLGYAVRKEAARGADAADALYTFFVEAAGVRLKRSYRVDLAGIRPASSMRLQTAEATARGSSSSPLDAREPTPTPTRTPASRSRSVPDEVPGVVVSAAPSRPPAASASAAIATPRRATARADRVVSIPPASVGTGAVTGFTPPSAASLDPDPAERASLGAASVADAARLPSLPRKTNLYETRRSNYAALFARYATLRKEIMVFPNDSLVMGRENKRLARAIVAAFDPTQDVISVIGCSHGATALANGNETLATGRSYRVKEELMLAGIDPELVLEEGCWAGQHFEQMPARGVVVEHKRRTAG